MKLGALLVVCLTILILSATFPGCKSQSLSSIKVGMVVDYPPFAYRDGSSYRGVDVDIVDALAKRLGVSYEIIHVNFEHLLLRLQEGRYDFVVSSLSITPERAEYIDYSVPYYKTGQCVLKRADTDIVIDSLADLAPHHVGSQSITTGMQLLKKELIDTGIMPPSNLTSYPTNTAAVSALLDGRIDFVIMDKAPAASFVKSQPLVRAICVDTGEEYGIGFQKGYKHFDLINDTLKAMLEEGEITAILAKYGIEE